LRYCWVTLKEITFCLKVAILYDTAPCRPHMNRSITSRAEIQPNKKLTCSRWLGVILICSSETSVHIRTTWRCVPEDGNFHNYSRVNLKFYLIFCMFAKDCIACLTSHSQEPTVVRLTLQVPLALQTNPDLNSLTMDKSSDNSIRSQKNFCT
jgi:hypothetical protein